MAKISVNGEFVVNGKLTVNRFLDANKNIVVEGVFATHYYFEEITSLESLRYELTGIEVVSEIFGSDDFDIVYNFKADNLDVKNGYTNLSVEDINKFENLIYKEDGFLKESFLEIGGKENE